MIQSLLVAILIILSRMTRDKADASGGLGPRPPAEQACRVGQPRAHVGLPLLSPDAFLLRPAHQVRKWENAAFLNLFLSFLSKNL